MERDFETKNNELKEQVRRSFTEVKLIVRKTQNFWKKNRTNWPRLRNSSKKVINKEMARNKLPFNSRYFIIF